MSARKRALATRRSGRVTADPLVDGVEEVGQEAVEAPEVVADLLGVDQRLGEVRVPASPAGLMVGSVVK